MASGKEVVSQRQVDLGLGSKYRNVDACKQFVHQNIVYVTLPIQVSEEHALHLLSLLDALRQTLARQMCSTCC